MRMLAAVIASGALALFLASCSDRDPGAALEPSPSGAVATDTPTRTPIPAGQSDPEALKYLDQLQRFFDTTGTYGIDIEASNFVLPQWGGSDGGIVTVDVRSGEALANLQRTGDGNYQIAYIDRQTFFKRNTCSQWLRVPGGGAAVLTPFFLHGGRLSAAKNARIVGDETGKTVKVEADFEGLGRATIEFTRERGTPVALTSETATNNGRPLTWKFLNFGRNLVGDRPEGKTEDRGPGGRPC